MTKAGDKMLKAAQEALLIAQGDPDTISKIRVTPSCGCVFCDVGLTPDWVHDQPVHFLPKENRYVECKNPDSQSD